MSNLGFGAVPAFAQNSSAHGVALQQQLALNWNITNTAANMLGYNNSNIDIGQNNNTITFSSGGVSYTATVPTGTYTNDADFANAVQTALNTATAANGTAFAPAQH